MRPTKEIIDEIHNLEKMKPNVLPRSAFGDNHHDAIDAQVRALREGMDEGCAYDTFDVTGDEDIDADEGRAENVLSAALDAIRWAEGESEEAPSTEWSTLVK